ncbi:MAG: GumC family protein [Planctomycetota bacterium]
MTSKRAHEDPEATGDQTITNVSATPAVREGMFGDLPPALGTTGGAVIGARPPVWTALMKHRWVMTVTFVLVSGALTAAAWLLLAPQYRANAEIRVRPIIPRLVYRTDDNGQIPLYESFVNTQAAVVISPTVLQRVLEQPEVQATQWYQGEGVSPLTSVLASHRTAMERLRASLKVRPRGRTEIIDVFLLTDRPHDAQVIVNAVINQYIGYLRESSDRTSDVLYRQLLSQYRTLRDDIEAREKVIARLKKQFGADAPGELVTGERMQMEALEAELAEVQGTLALRLWQVSQWEAMLERRDDQPPEDASSIHPQFAADPQWMEMFIAYRNAEHALRVEAVHLGDEHPRMVELRERVRFTQDLLKAREQQLGNQLQAGLDQPVLPGGAGDAGGTLEMLQQHVAQLRFRKQLLAEELREQREGWARTLDDAEALAREQRTVQRKRELFADVRRRKEEWEMERNVPGSIEVLTRAFAPSEPVRDLRILGTVGAVVVGLLSGAAVALLKAGRDQTISEVDDLHQHLAIGAFLGHLPLLGRRRITAPDQNERVRESIRMVRTVLAGHIGTTAGAHVLVTSAGRGEGKSTVAVLLARSFARCNRSVLLVDADIRTRGISRQFGLGRHTGLIELLTADADESEMIVAGDEQRLSILPAGTHGGALDPEILSNGRLDAMMGRWRRRYDLVMLDSPPVLDVADGRILSRHADGTILVVREDVTQRYEVTDALRSIHAAGGRLWGTIFIGARRGAYREAQ